MKEIAVSSLMLIGFLFCLVASIGLVRFKDTLTRIHAATKAGAFGGTLVALGLALHFNDLASWVQAALFILFFYCTAPVAAHMIGNQAWKESEDPSDH